MRVSLRPKTNAVLAAVWGAVSIGIVVLYGEWFWASQLLGAVFGGVAGALQVRDCKAAEAELGDAATTITIRRALTTTGWGSAYLTCFVLAHVIFAGGSYALWGTGLWTVGFLASAMAFAFVREVVALPTLVAIGRRGSQPAARERSSR